MNQFSDLALSSLVKANLARHNFVEMTPVQAGSLQPALEGRDVVATAQTGTGKTLAFVLPLIEKLAAQREKKGVQAVILSPTRELAIQIHETFLKIGASTGIRAAVVVGGMSEQNQLRSIQGGAQVLIATPGRLCDFLNRKLVYLGKAGFVVLDEADRMLDMGFLPSIKLILGLLPAERQTLFFSATMEKSVASLVEGHVKNPVRVAIGSTSKPAEHVNLSLYEVDTDRRLNLLMHLLGEAAGSFLVFARTKHGADRLADRLDRLGVRAARIHGNRTQNQRNQALAGFKNGDFRVLVATDVAARGIHVDGIGTVVNFDLPQMAEDFIHRVGRTGRAGARGHAITFAARGERREIRAIEKALGLQLTVAAMPADLPVIDVKALAMASAAHSVAEPYAKAAAGGPAKAHGKVIEMRKPGGKGFAGKPSSKNRPKNGSGDSNSHPFFERFNRGRKASKGR
jgi:ATP-dependent RNA helicase RhlE